MITIAEIEALAVQMADPGFDLENMDAVVGHLSRQAFDMVYERCQEIYAWRITEMEAGRDSVVGLRNLARAAGCPKGVAVLPWLQERGLAEEVDGEWKYKRAKLGVVT